MLGGASHRPPSRQLRWCGVCGGWVAQCRATNMCNARFGLASRWGALGARPTARLPMLHAERAPPLAHCWIDQSRLSSASIRTAKHTHEAVSSHVGNRRTTRMPLREHPRKCPPHRNHSLALSHGPGASPPALALSRSGMRARCYGLPAAPRCGMLCRWRVRANGRAEQGPGTRRRGRGAASVSVWFDSCPLEGARFPLLPSGSWRLARGASL